MGTLAFVEWHPQGGSASREASNEGLGSSNPLDQWCLLKKARLAALLELAKEAPLLEPTSPDLYQGYEERKVSNVSDYGEVIATVEEVHRFPADDAIVLFGEIQNKSAHPVTFDPGAITIGIGDRQYPNAFVDCASSVEAGATIKFGVIGQG